MGKKYSDEALREIYADWRSSGLRQGAYCQEKGIKSKVFKTDMWKLRCRDRAEQSEKQRGQFNRVSVSAAIGAKAESYCEIRFSGGHRVEFSGPESVIGLKQLIQTLVQH